MRGPKTGVSVAPQKGLMSFKIYFKKTQLSLQFKIQISAQFVLTKWSVDLENFPLFHQLYSGLHRVKTCFK